MNNHKLIMEGWRDFFGSLFGPEEPKFDENHDKFYYKEPYLASSKDNITSTDNLVKIIVDHPVAEHFMVRPGTMGHQGEFYNWKKFKTLNSKVEEIKREKEEAIRKTLQQKAELVKRALKQGTTDSDLALAILEGEGVDTLVLYRPKNIEQDGLPIVIGMISLESTDKPCIPNTLQVRYAAVAKRFQKSGFGSILYRLAAAHAKKTKNGGGITSDHAGSTSKDAERRWSAIDSSSDFHKRTTKQGSNTFDYTGSKTPDDPEDDCEFPEDNPAVSHSYGVNDNVLQIYEGLVVADLIYNKDDFLYAQDDLNRKAFKVFDKSYMERGR